MQDREPIKCCEHLADRCDGGSFAGADGGPLGRLQAKTTTPPCCCGSRSPIASAPRCWQPPPSPRASCSDWTGGANWHDFAGARAGPGGPEGSARPARRRGAAEPQRAKSPRRTASNAEPSVTGSIPKTVANPRPQVLGAAPTTLERASRRARLEAAACGGTGDAAEHHSRMVGGRGPRRHRRAGRTRRASGWPRAAMSSPGLGESTPSCAGATAGSSPPRAD